MTLVIIPARMGSTRLPVKPLLKIGDRTLIERCFERASVHPLWPIVATDSREIFNLFPGRAVLTGGCNSGTDRVAAAAEIIDPVGEHEFIINVQGDMPFLDTQYLKDFVEFREQTKCDILTGITNFNGVSVFTDEPVEFIRTSNICHVGIYGYTREAIRRFTSMPQSVKERGYNLEQCRATDKFTWKFFDCDSMPIEINTQADLDRARSCLM